MNCEPILHSIQNSIEAIAQLQKPSSLRFLEQAAHMLVATFQTGNKLLVAGNGGSLSEAVHFAEELTGQFRKPRPALPAIAISDPSYLTCTANDFGFSSVFSRAVEAYGKPDDLFVGLSTSGNSENILRAFHVAKKMELRTIAFLGKDGGKAKGVADLELIIEGKTSDRIQEGHLTAIHILIELVEKALYPVDAEAFTQFTSKIEISI